MTQSIRTAFLTCLAIGLAGCQQTAPSAPIRAAQPVTSMQPAKTTQSVSPAVSACLAAVANKVGKGDVSTISVDPSQAGTSVMVRVPGAQAPWNCAYQGGRVVNVFYTGSEGAL